MPAFSKPPTDDVIDLKIKVLLRTMLAGSDMRLIRFYQPHFNRPITLLIPLGDLNAGSTRLWNFLGMHGVVACTPKVQRRLLTTVQGSANTTKFVDSERLPQYNAKLDPIRHQVL